MGRNGALGIIVPISDRSVMHDIFHGRSVYVSLAGDDPSDSLEKGDRIFFYDPGRTKNLIGEAKVSDITLGEAGRVGEEFRGRLHLDAGAFEAYTSTLSQGKKSVMRLLHYEGATVYAAPVKCGLEVPERGLLVTQQVFAEIAKQNS